MDIPIKDRRIALVGGAGFIGHNLALELKKQGAQVEIIDSLQVNNLLSFVPKAGQPPINAMYYRMINQRLALLEEAGIPVHVVDARDYPRLNILMRDVRPQVIVHLAAVAHANRANKDPQSTFDHSLRTLENVLDYARSKTIEHLVYFSSSMAYGNFMTPEVDEEHPLNPIAIYGAIKAGSEKIIQAYHNVFGFDYTIIRPSALYGPRCVSRRVGQLFIESALSGTKLQVDGDGSDRIDFTYIDDLVDGVIRVIGNAKARNEIFNITYGQSRSIAELVEVIRKEFPGIEIEKVERDKLLPYRGTLSVRKAQELLGYTPRFPIEIGFPKYIANYRQTNESGDIAITIDG